ncbi:MAG TPA: inorganic diphosphatase [Candidatus Dormibacteraeota bacterium]|nr:inorganic diphosphatase [Candidatus Dormibacteraeota bacterium]
MAAPRRTSKRRSAEPAPIEVIVEVPAGSRNKYEVNAETGRIELDRVIFAATRYPADYGYIPHTLAGDGDPLDALVLVDEPTFPGCHIRCHPIAVLEMTDQKGSDEKILMRPAFESRTGWKDLRDIPEPMLREIAHFFQVCKDLEEGTFSKVKGWKGMAAAERIIEAARVAYAKHQDGRSG